MLFFILATCLQWLLSLSTCDHILTTVYDWKISATIIELHQYFLYTYVVVDWWQQSTYVNIRRPWHADRKCVLITAKS